MAGDAGEPEPLGFVAAGLTKLGIPGLPFDRALSPENSISNIWLAGPVRPPELVMKGLNPKSGNGVVPKFNGEFMFRLLNGSRMSPASGKLNCGNGRDWILTAI